MAAKKKAAKKPAEKKPKRTALVAARRRKAAPRSTEEAPDVSIVSGPLDKLPGSGDEFVFEDYGFYRKTPKPPCEWKIQYKKGGGKTGGKPMHPGRVELAMITNEESSKMGLPPGPAIRLCAEANKPAPIVSVTDPAEALKIATTFRDCVVVKKGDPKKCGIDTIAKARGIPAAKVQIAGLRKRSRR